jgi:hypothetical protein
VVSEQKFSIFSETLPVFFLCKGTNSKKETFMNYMVNLKSLRMLALSALASFALAPLAQAAPGPKPEDRGNGNSAAENVQALKLGTTGSENTAHGWFSLISNTTGGYNTADGYQALYSNTTGEANTATGWHALLNNTEGNFNTATGFRALELNTTGYQNTATGVYALNDNTTGIRNTATGYGALFSNTTAEANTAHGWFSLYSNTTGNSNTADGFNALFSNTTGVGNSAVGYGAFYYTTGNGNTGIGSFAGLNVSTASNVICIGANVGGADVSNTTWIGNVYGNATISAQTAPVIVSVDGQLATVVSSQRFKKDIVTMEKASEAIMSLRPVTFHYKTDNTGTPQFGLIAEEVAKVNPALVLPDKEGKPYTVRYDAVNAMMLNEFLKEHKAFLEEQRKVGEQEKTIVELKSGMTALAATLKEQAAQIQKVSAQLEASRPAPQVVENNR